MPSFRLIELATTDNFEEGGYLAANPDVAAAVRDGLLRDGRQHFEAFPAEMRQIRRALPPEWKHQKLGKVRRLLRDPGACRETLNYIDCMTDELRQQFNIVPTENVSAHEYDHEAQALIERHSGGLILDCGAGLRNSYYDNIVNYEIVAYDSTDVLGVAERLPFKDDSFDAVLSMNVLEHVKDPFQAARELMRVLKSGGELMCVAPFLQPLHGYPHHYYNMTATGLSNLFEPLVEKRLQVYGALRPIHALSWFLNSYHAGLPDAQRERFSAMTVAELMASPLTLERDTIVTLLSASAATELASAHALLAKKRD